MLRPPVLRLSVRSWSGISDYTVRRIFMNFGIRVHYKNWQVKLYFIKWIKLKSYIALRCTWISAHFSSFIYFFCVKCDGENLDIMFLSRFKFIENRCSGGYSTAFKSVNENLCVFSPLLIRFRWNRQIIEWQ
jgi:hypothetical protein